MQRKPALVKLFRQQKGRCALCGSQMQLAINHANTATIDHRVPKSLGLT